MKLQRIHDEIQCCILFSDDMVLIEENPEEVKLLKVND